MKHIMDGIMGLATGDALGVPVEFFPKKLLQENPVTSMREFGVHHQPKGTWSDDTSMTLALLDSLTCSHGINYDDIMQKYLEWFTGKKYLCTARPFGVGKTVNYAIMAYCKGKTPLLCGGTNEQDNGNGSLMRILPIAYYFERIYGSNGLFEEQMQIIHNLSALTHRHMRSVIGCSIYIMIAKELIHSSASLYHSIVRGISLAMGYYESMKEKEAAFYDQLKDLKDFAGRREEEITSSGYIVHTLEAAIWCLLNTDSYRQCVLKAVNLGGDTDTAAAVAGGLAGLYYGFESIPVEWIDVLAEKDYILKLCSEFDSAFAEE